MTLTRITSDGITDSTIATADLADQSVTLAKLPHGTSSNDGKFLRANNGADPTFESVVTDLVNDTSPQLGGDLDTNSHNILLDDDHYVKFGDSSDFTIRHTGGANAIDAAAGQYLYINSDNLRLNSKTGSEKYITGTVNGAVELYHDNVKRLETASSRVVIRGASGLGVYGETGANNDGLIQIVPTGSAVYSRLNLYNAAGNQYASLFAHAGQSLFLDTADNGHINFRANGTGDHIFQTNGAERMRIDGTDIKLPDSQKINFGTGNDLQIYHDGSNSYLLNATGEFQIANSGNGNAIFLQAKAGENSVKALANGAVELYHDNTKRFETQTGGAAVTGGLNVSGNIALPDGSIFIAGTGDDLQIYFDGTVGHIKGISGVQGINVATSNVERYQFTDGSIRPLANNTYDLGTSSLRWQNIYTNDLNLSNEGGANDVDGTWGSYTIQEGAEDLFLVNKRSGKKYKFNLTEVS